MSLTRTAGRMFDGILAGTPGFEGFHAGKAGGAQLRRYFHDAGFALREVSVDRDRYWSPSAGGEIRADLWAFVPEAQRALHGVDQDWRAPDWTAPLFYQQHALACPANGFRHRVTDADSLAAAGTAFAEWLQTIALPWFARFETPAGLIADLDARGAFDLSARLALAFGDPDGAATRVHAFVDALPRRADDRFERLGQEGLLDDASIARLRQASMQTDEDYRRAVDVWLAERGAARAAPR